MKSFLTFCFITTYILNVTGQVKKDNYTTTIKNANVVNITKGNVTIGQIIINQTVKPKILLSSSSQEKNADGIYETIFVFSNPDNMPFFNVNISLKFNKPIISSGLHIEGMAQVVHQEYNKNMTEYSFTASQISSASPSIIIKSKEPIQTIISGIDGKVN